MQYAILLAETIFSIAIFIDFIFEQVTNTTVTYTLQNLPPFSDLRLMIRAVTVGPGPKTIVQFKSPEGLPEEPTDILVILFRGDGMSIKWKKPKRTNGHIVGYKVSVRILFEPKL